MAATLPDSAPLGRDLLAQVREERSAADASERRILKIAVEYAHAVYTTSLSPLPVITEVVAEATAARARLLSLADTLAAWNLLDPQGHRPHPPRERLP